MRFINIHIRIYALLFLTAFSITVKAQSFNDARSYFNDFITSLDTKGETNNGYDLLYKSYSEYTRLLTNGRLSAGERATAVDNMSIIFPYLLNAAYYFTSRNNNAKALQFAECYLDLSLNPQLNGINLVTDENYPQIAFFAASNNYNSKNYAKAIPYFRAYIESNDSKNLSTSYNYYAKCYINLGDYNNGLSIIQSGLQLFPSDLQMLTTVINLLAETQNNDNLLQKYITQALKYKPSDEGLLYIQLQLHERRHEYTDAANIVSKLRKLKPNSIELAKHSAAVFYNSGVQYLDAGNISQAKKYFNEASTVIDAILREDPLAINYCYALANAYSVLGDVKNLEKINQRIMALGEMPVKEGERPNSYLGLNAEHRALSNQSTFNVPSSYSTQNTTYTPIPQNINTQTQNNASVSITTTSLNSNNSSITGQTKPSNASTNSPIIETTTITHHHPSDVDNNIPITGYNNDNVFAVIISNSNYQKVPAVSYADNDGRVFAEYCNKTLGIPKRNIRTYYDVNLGDLLDAIEDIKNIAKAKKGNLDVIFYYAGHGIPDDVTKTAYILPVDADGKNLKRCFPLKELYSELSSMHANKTIVFMDACFSGTSRSDSSPLLSSRGVALKVNESEIKGDLIVFSAASGSQTALPYDEQSHGLFTYFLLKKLKDTKGKLKLGDLADYLTETVSLESQIQNRKQQTPTVTAGGDLDKKSWRNQSLID